MIVRYHEIILHSPQATQWNAIDHFVVKIAAAHDVDVTVAEKVCTEGLRDQQVIGLVVEVNLD